MFHDIKIMFKGGLISEDIFNLDPLPKKRCTMTLLSRKFEFPASNLVNNLFKFSAQESDLAPFFGNGTKVKIPSEMNLPLGELRQARGQKLGFKITFFTFR